MNNKYKTRPIRNKFYHTTEWKKVRDYYFTLKMGMCERCKKDKGYLNKGIIVHHKKYIKDQDFITWNKEILLSINNLELLCLECHNKEHMREKAFNDNAEINLETGEYIIDKK